MCLKPIVVTYSPRLNDRKHDLAVKAPYKHSILCQCGKCEECLKQYQNDWMCRIYSELQRQSVAVFFTFTYREDAVPEVFSTETGERFTSVEKEPLQRLFKQMREDRRKNGKSTDFRWFITSEYGPTTLRAHYHGLILGLSKLDCLPYFNKWKKNYGFYRCREVTNVNSKSALCTIRYTAKYCAKGEFENPYIKKGFIEPTFHLISKSIGNNYLTDAKLSYYRALDFPHKRNSDGSYNVDYLEEIRKRLNFVIPPCTYHLPRYYRERVFEKRKDLSIAYQDYVCEQLLEQCSPTLVRLQTEKPYRCYSEADRQGVRSDYEQVVRDIKQRASDSRKSVVNHFKKSKI